MKTKNTKKSAIAAQLGRRGGKAVAKRGKAYMRKIGRKGAKARWGNENATGTTE